MNTGVQNIKRGILNNENNLVIRYDYSNYDKDELDDFASLTVKNDNIQLFIFFHQIGANVADQFINACKFASINIIEYLFNCVYNKDFSLDNIIKGLEEAVAFDSIDTLNFLLPILPQLTNNEITANDIIKYIDQIVNEKK